MPALMLGVCALLALGLFVAKSLLASGARLDADVHIADTGIDSDGYWYVHLAISNTGTLSWSTVWVDPVYLTGTSPIAVELGSTLPYGSVPREFTVTVEGMREDEQPFEPDTLELTLSVLSAEPWYLPEAQLASWSHSLELQDMHWRECWPA
jgi:hypothetical protein